MAKKKKRDDHFSAKHKRSEIARKGHASRRLNRWKQEEAEKVKRS